MIIAGLLGAAKIACGIIAARTVGKGLSAIGQKITPYNKTKAYKQAEYSNEKQKEFELMREAFQKKLQQENIQAQERIAIFNRRTSMLIAEMNAYTNLRHILVQDAIRNFPLNISPLVLLENNNIDISFLLGDRKYAGVDLESIDKIYEGIDKPKPLNVFITPIHVDARVGGKELLAAQVFDAMYSSLESVFVNEYSRNGERPVVFYSTAWNKNVRGGLHAADELYYFLKEMPTIVVEPRFDGKTIKLMFSCWGIGYSSQLHSRQEIQIPLDLNSMIAVSAYERSKKAIASIAKVSSKNKSLNEQRAMFEHNVSIFEELGLGKRIEKRLNEITETGKSTELDELGDYSKLFYINPTDVLGLADTISATTGMMIAAISDTHHLLANDVTPRFPYIFKDYFGDYITIELREKFGKMYERTYLKLAQDFPEQEPRRLAEKGSVQKLLGVISSEQVDKDSDIHYALIQKCKELGVKDTIVSNWSTTQLIKYYIEHLDDDVRFRESLDPWLSPEQRREMDSKILQNESFNI